MQFVKLKEAINRIRYTSTIIHHIFNECNTVALIPDSLYYYVQRSGSIISSEFNPKRLNYIDGLYDRYIFCKKHNYESCAVAAFSSGIYMGLILCSLRGKSGRKRLYKQIFRQFNLFCIYPKLWKLTFLKLPKLIQFSEKRIKKSALVFFRKTSFGQLIFTFASDLKRIIFSWRKSEIKEACRLCKEYLKALPLEKRRLMKPALWQYARYGTALFTAFIKSYANPKLEKIKIISTEKLCRNDITIICNVKNDLARVRAQLEYYRKYGIKHFAFIDNMSDDGTYEFLFAQDDVSLFRTSEKYNSGTMMAWKRLVTDEFGYDRWYLQIDSDEFFSYPGMERVPFPKFVEFLESKGISVVHSFMLDMYAKANLFAGTDETFIEDFCWFDADSYGAIEMLTAQRVQGGPRTRMLHTTSWFVSKYPLAKMQENMVMDNHLFFPRKYSFQTGVVSVLKHYKFIPSDAERYVRIIKDGNYWNGSEEYKQYVRFTNESPNPTFWYDGSVRFESSEDLLKIGVFDRSLYDEYVKGATYED